MTLKELCKEYYPKDQYLVVEEFDGERAKDMLGWKSSPCWAQSKIGNTGWYKLAQYSPRSKGDKIGVLVCKRSLLN